MATLNTVLGPIDTDVQTMMVDNARRLHAVG